MSSPNDIPEEDLIFEEALKIDDPARRAAYLKNICGDNEALRSRLEGLLSAAGEAERFFDESRSALDTLLPVGSKEAAGAAGTAPGGDASLIGQHIGRYKLLEVLGVGGWGSVYLAEQSEPVHRRVALKIIRGGMETSAIVARFETERQALAMMDHPSIARVFDAGSTDRGLPYFVMELVQGEKITEYCNRHRLDIKARLQLFVRICHAIQHAHQKGVIHRDIKPSNIMVALVDEEPVPKVIDFGIAKATEASLTNDAAGTAYVQLIGTPAYMSPEQAELRWMDVDTRSDIYSLGVLLYELLTGYTPFDAGQLTKAGINEMRKILREKEPPRPSARLLALNAAERRARAEERSCDAAELLHQIEGDLDWIVTKSLEKERQQRYETANGLAMDLQRHLQHEAVFARPPSLWYTLQKAVRRNRLLFAAGAAVGLALCAGMGTSLWLLLREREMRQRAVDAESQQARLREAAEVREKISQASLLISQERYPEVDSLLKDLHIDKPAIEASAALRALGEWHAIEGRYGSAALIFAKLRMLNAIDGWDIVSLDDLRYGPVLVLKGDLEQYDSFRREMLAQYLASPKPLADRVIKGCMLTPIDVTFRDRLVTLRDQGRIQAREADANGDPFQAAWTCMSMAICDFRCGDYAAAENWAKRCLSYSDYNAPRAATAHGVLALTYHATGRREEARTEWQLGMELIERKSRTPLGRGTPVQGFWFDWAFARILLNEGASQLGIKDSRSE